jgi:hypothetical protein
MVVIKSIIGAIIGGIVGYIAIFPVALIIEIVDIKLDIDRNRVDIILGLLVLAGVIIGIAVPIIEKINEDAKRQKERDERERTAKAERSREQQGYHTQMIVLGEESIGLFESMPQHLRSAEKYLDQAEVDFGDGAFAPFWDSIEHAAKALGRFDEGVHHIKDNSSRYTELTRKYESTPPPFPLARQSVVKLRVGTATAERMKAIVRTAQRNFQFATIYEQRKTNKILVAGFTNLAQALEQMTWQITTSIDDLASSVDVMTSTLDKSMHAIHSRMSDMAERTKQHHDEFMKEASERATREKKVLEMLDNIQRGRRPFP